MSARHFLAPLAVLAAGVVALNVSIDRASANSQPRALFATIDRASGVTDLFLGSSLMAQSIDVGAWESARPGSRAINTGFNATFSVEHNILLRRAAVHRPANIYYAFSDFELSRTAAETEPLLSGNAAVFDALDPGTAVQFRGDTMFKRWRLWLDGLVPLMTNRFSAWARVEQLRRRLAKTGWPYPDPPPDFEPLGEEPFARDAGRYADGNAVLSAPITDVFRRASGTGATVYLIQVPATSSHRRRYFATPEWQRYHAAIESKMRDLGVVFIDASEWSRDDEFHDSIHLNAESAVILTRRLEAATRK